MSLVEQEAVLFIHSTGTGPFLWSGVSDAIIGKRRRLFPANVGYPPNPMIERGRKISASDDASEVLRCVPPEAERVHIVAHSYGALVALRALPSLGGRVASIFFYEPVVFGALAAATDVDPEAVAQAREFLTHPWFLHDEERGGLAEWQEAFIDYWNRPGSWSRMPESMRELSLSLGWKMFQEVRSCFFDTATFEEWRFDAPTTIAVGDRTTLASKVMAQRMARDRSNVTLTWVAGANHMAPLTQPHRVHEVLAHHMAREGARAIEERDG